mgnify:CR=1 FL=1
MRAEGVRAYGLRAMVPWALALLLAAAVAVGFGPWVRTGAGARSSFEAMRTADRLDLFDDGVRTVLTVAWGALPFVAALGAAAVALGWSRVAATAGLAVGGVVLALASLIVLGPPEAAWAAPVGAVVGAALLAVSLVATVIPAEVGPRGTPAADAATTAPADLAPAALARADVVRTDVTRPDVTRPVAVPGGSPSTVPEGEP